MLLASLRGVDWSSENFARVLFSQNFADAEFREIKTFAKWRKHSLTNVGKSCQNCDFLTWQISFFKAIRKNKILAKTSEFTICNCIS